MKRMIRIEIVSDMVCPWCYIGKRRLEKAMELLKTEFEFETEYLPFELHPSIPSEGLNQREYLEGKFGGPEEYERIMSHVSRVAMEEGLQFDFAKQMVVPNTRRAHALVQYAKTRGLHEQVVEILFNAYFSTGIDLSSNSNLVALGVKAGLDREETEQLFADDQATLNVALQEEQMYKVGITGVPFYIINGKYGISGAQPSHIFVEAFQNVGKVLQATNSTVT
jgi:predicted DsbA family dithiol-disulfide isomerase